MIVGAVHYCVGNMPGAVPQTSTYAAVAETHCMGSIALTELMS